MTTHTITDAWFCECCKTFYVRRPFEEHLTAEHPASKEEHSKLIKAERCMCQNGHCKFWCGFCNDIVRVEPGHQELDLQSRKFALLNEAFEAVFKH